MGEHRVDKLAARNQPVPGPAPSGPVIDILDVSAKGAPSTRRDGFRRHRLQRRLTRFLRSRRGRWTLAVLACVVVLIVGLLAQGFLSNAAPSRGGLPDAAAGSSLSGGAPSPSGAPSSPATSKGGVVTNPVNYLKSHFPDNPLNHLRFPGLHQVTVSATSRGGMFVVGYLVPTGLGATFGKLPRGHGSWSMSERAIGRGYLAAVFIQTDKTGVPITCTVSVDGKVTDQETTSGAYGRNVCLG